MPALPLILLPPSEGKLPGGRGAAWTPGTCSFPDLDDQRVVLRDALIDAMDGPESELKKLLGVKDVALDRAIEVNRALLTSGTTAAQRRYTGVLYDALGLTELDGSLRRRANTQLIIFSGLWGLVRPGDKIPDYKLKMGAALPGLPTGTSQWKPLITAAISERVGRRTVWDLLPGEHRSAWSPSPREAARTIRVRFLDDVERNGTRQLVTVSHWNKLLKGALVRFLLDTGLDGPDGLTAFEHPEGYQYSPELTETDESGTSISFVARRSAVPHRGAARP